MMRRIGQCVGFLVFAALCTQAARGTDGPFGDNVLLRSDLNDSRHQFLTDKSGTVAFLGGSITEMNGFRPMVMDLLQKRFPETKFNFINAGIASTCSTTGAFRLDHDILSGRKVDLLFVEFAVNDDQDAHHTRAECIRGMEGIVRHARAANPNVDIIFTHFVNQAMLNTLQAGQTPLTIEAHNAVAERYGVPTVNLAREVAAEITAGKLTWAAYGGVHPAATGNRLCANMIDELFNRAWSQPPEKNEVLVAHPPAAPVDALNYEQGRFIDPKEAKLGAGWKVELPVWAQLAGSTRAPFTRIPMLCATAPSEGDAALATLEFTGTTVGAYVVAGPDAGIVEASVDGGTFHSVDLYHTFSKTLHYPRTVIFGTDLKPGKHTLVIRMAPTTSSAGHAARIMQFVAN